MPTKFCCTDLEYAIETGDIIHNAEKNEFYAYGRPSSVDDGDGYTDDMTETLRMRHCLFCGKRLATTSPPPPISKGEVGVFTVGHKCPNCKHMYNIDVCATTTTCPECGHSEFDI